jgi:hypothetical protein
MPLNGEPDSRWPAQMVLPEAVAAQPSRGASTGPAEGHRHPTAQAVGATRTTGRAARVEAGALRLGFRGLTSARV